MAWTSPLTWAVGQLVTAAQLNTHLRDNMNETAPAKVTTAGDIVYATAANTLARLGIGSTNQILRVVAGLPSWQSLFGVAPSSVAYTNTEGANNAAARADHVHAVALTTASANLGSDVSISSTGTWFDGPSVSLGAGTWLIVGGLTIFFGSPSSSTFAARLTDGTTTYAGGVGINSTTSGVAAISISASAIVTLGATTTVKMQASGSLGTIKASMTQSNAAAVSPASWIQAVKIG